MSVINSVIRNKTENLELLQLRKFFDFGLALHCIIDSEGNFIKVNKALENLVGQTECELLKQNIIDFVHPDDVVVTRAALPGLNERQKITGAINRYRCKNSTYRYIDWNIYPDGKWLYVVARDVTERIENECELAYNRSLIDATLESTADGILVVDNEQRIRQYNGKFVDMWRVPAALLEQNMNEQLLQHILLQVVNPEEYLAQIRQLYATPDVKSLETVALVDGRILERFSQPQKYAGKITGRFWSFRDITERRKVEDTLSESENRFRMLFERHSAPMLTINPNTSAIIDANQAASALYGWSVDELRTMNLLQLNVLPRLNVSEKYDSLSELNSAGVELLHRLKDGSLRDVEIFSNRIAIRGEEVLYSVIHDITVRKLAEADSAYLSFHDALTGLYNRRYFESELQQMDNERQLPIAIISCDVNSLKMTNDIFGHAQGDQLIVTAARILQSSCRSGGIVVRYGGDEFMMFLPRCKQAEVAEIANLIHAKCRKEMVNGVPVSLALGFAIKNQLKEDINAVSSLAETRMYKNKYSDDNRVRYETLAAILLLAQNKDNNAAERSRRLRELAISFGEYLGLPNATISDLAMLTTLHDIGKISVSENILKKHGTLSEQEWMEIKTHPVIGCRILRAIRDISYAVEEGMLAHHEHWDGSGYPKGLESKEIPYISRLISVIDAYEAMTYDQPYRNAVSRELAIEELQRCAGTQFDPELVVKFIEFLGTEGEH